MPDLSGKVALVTGSSRGIGRLITEHLLDGGATVIGFARSAPTIDRKGYRHILVDVADPASVAEAFIQVSDRCPALHILINNAAVLTSTHAVLMPPSAAQAMINTNLLGTYLVSREAAKLMKRQKWGRIINMGSMAASLQPAGDSVYAATKAGAAVMANVLAKELGRWGITCNTVAVSATPSDMLDQLPREKVLEIIGNLPIPRMAEPDDILNVIDFLLSDRSGYITAQTIWMGGVH